MNVLQNLRPSFSFIQLLVLAVGITGAASQAVGQAGTSETVIQRAEEQFENSPLKTTSLGRDLYVFSGDGGKRYCDRRRWQHVAGRQRSGFAHC
jgi:hypothetical protein